LVAAAGRTFKAAVSFFNFLAGIFGREKLLFGRLFQRHGGGGRAQIPRCRSSLRGNGRGDQGGCPAAFRDSLSEITMVQQRIS
jgi:hypothetical protein